MGWPFDDGNELPGWEPAGRSSYSLALLTGLHPEVIGYSAESEIPRLRPK